MRAARESGLGYSRLLSFRAGAIGILWVAGVVRWAGQHLTAAAEITIVP